MDCRGSKQRAAAGRRYRLKRKYNLTEAEYQEMVAIQGGRCRLCGVATTLVVDHDHGTGLIRGLLCSPCNLGLGFLRDNPEVILRAASYVA
jgi:hypothetical protein